MKATNSQSIVALLKKYGLRPRKGLGQNFLIDPFHLDKIIAAAELTPADLVLEIGPGPGSLTRLLAEAAGHVIAVELDPALVNLLRQEYAYLKNLTIIEADILETDIQDLLDPHAPTPPLASSPNLPIPQSPNLPISQSLNLPVSPSSTPFKVVANLPYYITSAAIRHLLEATPQPQRLVFTLQKEVARRIVAEPGDMSILAVSVQLYGRAELVHHIPAGAFYPPPKVDSAVVRIDTYDQPPIPVADVEQFFRVVKAGFGQKRKQLKNSLKSGLPHAAQAITGALEAAGIDPKRRAETLSLAEWGRLAECLHSA